MEPEEEAGGAAVREVYDEAGVKGKLGRPSGVLQQNQDQKQGPYVYVLTATEILEGQEESVSVGRKRQREDPKSSSVIDLSVQCTRTN